MRIGYCGNNICVMYIAMAERRTRLYNGNMFDILPTIEEGIVDLAVIDLPYGCTACPWDIKVELPKLWEQLHRVSTENAIWIFFANFTFGMEVVRSNPEQFRFELIWDKVKGTQYLNAKKRPMPNHEFMLVFTAKKSGYTYNLDGHVKTQNIVRSYEPKHSIYGSALTTHGSYEPRLPCTIVQKTKGRYRKGQHPSEKPEEIYEWLIQYFSREGNTILDPCFGSGNSGIVSERMNRSYIGIEMDVAYYEKGIKKIEESAMERTPRPNEPEK